MKIIGKTEEGYLISATQDDIYRLVGHRYLRHTEERELTAEQLDFKRQQQWIGLTIPLDNMYEAARELAQGWNDKRELKETIRGLRRMAEELESIGRIYNLPLEGAL